MRNLVKVVGYKAIPFVNDCFEGYPKNCSNPAPGTFVLYSQLVMSGLNVEFVKVRNKGAMYDKLSSGLADLTAVPETVRRLPYHTHFRFTLPIIEDTTVLIVKDLSPVKLSPDLLFHLCHWSMWLLVVVSFVFALCYKFLHSEIFTRLRLKRHQAQYSHKFPLICWGFAFAIFSEIYQNSLGITLTIQLKPSPVFSDTETLYNALVSGRCNVVLKKQAENSWYHLLNPDSPLVTAVQNKIDTGDAIIANSELDWIRKIKEKDCNVGFSTTNEFVLLESRYDGLEMRKLKEMPINHYVYLYRRNSTYKYQFRWIGTFGSSDDQFFRVLSKEAKKIKHFNLLDDDHESQTNSKKPVTFYQLSSCFVVLLVGLGTSSFIFAANWSRALIERKRNSVKRDSVVEDFIV